MITAQTQNKRISIAPFSVIKLLSGTVVLGRLEQYVVIKLVHWSEQRHICTESLKFKVNCDYLLCLGWDGLNNWA